MNRLGFSLIELLVVIGIIALLMGMVSYDFAKTDVRRQAVKAAADELAATCRRARALAMERKTVHAVVFHIQNKPGSSGLVLNNRSGGHWYRILGPGTADTADRPQIYDDLPAIAAAGYNFKPHSLFETAELIDRAWADEAHVLPAGKARLLALSDMDYGDITDISGAYRGVSAHDSYPRPWFGWYDAVNKRLWPWGGYDPTVDGSGFFYWGMDRTIVTTATGTVPIGIRDPRPTTCEHTATRSLAHWDVGQTNYRCNEALTIPNQPSGDVLYTAGTPRPLIDAAWRDCSLVFLSTGEVRWGNWMPGRHSPYLWNGKNTAAGPAFLRGANDRCNGSGLATYSGDVNQHTQAEAGNFDQDSGGWFITIAPDSLDDNDRFDTAQAALASISPLYRVFVTRLGEVRVIAVSRSDHLQGLTTFPPAATWWRNAGNMQVNFPADRHLDGSVLGGFGQGRGAVQGRPITDFVTPTMLSERQVWLK